MQVVFYLLYRFSSHSLVCSFMLFDVMGSSKGHTLATIVVFNLAATTLETS